MQHATFPSRERMRLHCLSAVTVALLSMSTAFGAEVPGAASLTVAAAAPCPKTIQCDETILDSVKADGDTDCFSLEMDAGDAVAITVGKEPGSNLQFFPRWQLFGPEDEPVGEPCSTQCERYPDETGIYSIRIFDNNLSASGNYSLTLQAITPVLNGEASCAQPLPCGETMLRSLDAGGDTDSFAFDADAGEAVAITVGKEDGSDVQFFPRWELFGPSGEPLGEVCFNQCEHALTLSGTYTVKVFDNNNAENGNYSLTMQGISATLDGTAACGEAIAYDDPILDSVEAGGDTDAFRFEADSGDAISLAIAKTGGSDVHFLPHWRLFDPHGEPVGDLCSTGQCQRHLTAAGIHTAKVFDNNYAETGNYSFTLSFLEACPSGYPCDDGVFCNGPDTCVAGACSAHQGDPCPGADADPDCSESCSETSDSCDADDPNGAECDDSLFCNGLDSCAGGTCTGHAGDPCAGGGDCERSCSESGDTCLAAEGTPCGGDNDICTDDACNGLGVCLHLAIPGCETTTTSTTVTSTTASSTTTTTSTTSTTTTTLQAVCGKPTCMCPDPVTATDCLYILQAAVKIVGCALCVCDVNSSGSTSASDALACLQHAVGQSVELACPACS